MNWINVSNSTYVAQMPNGILVRTHVYGSGMTMAFVPGVMLGVEEDGTFRYERMPDHSCRCRTVEQNYLAICQDCPQHGHARSCPTSPDVVG